jgi:hypothetical protein
MFEDPVFFNRLFGISDGPEYDLDAIAFLLDKNGKVADLGMTVPGRNGREIACIKAMLSTLMLCGIRAEKYG